MDSTISPVALRKVTKELYAIHEDPPEGIRLILNEDSITDIQAWILGPEGTPYEGGCFRVRIQLVPDFPNSPPKCYFLTRIFHPNVSAQGDVCVSTLKKDWKKELGIRHILLVVKCLLIVPNPESALNEEAGRQLLECYDDYARHAQLMTDIHAQSHRREIFPASTGAPITHADGEFNVDLADGAATSLQDSVGINRSSNGSDEVKVESTILEREGTDKKKQAGVINRCQSLASVRPTPVIPVPPSESASASSIITPLTTAPSSQPSSAPLLAPNSSVSSMTYPISSCSTTLSLLSNGCPPCASRPNRKRKASTDEQHQEQQAQQCPQDNAIKTMDTISITLPATVPAVASVNHTHVQLSCHASSKLPVQQQDIKTASRASVPQQQQQLFPGRLLPGAEYEGGIRCLPFLGAGWPASMMTDPAASHSSTFSQPVTVLHDHDKKRSLRRL